MAQSIIIIDSNGGALPFNIAVVDSIPNFFSTMTGYYVLFGISILWLFLVLTFHHGFGKHKEPVEKRQNMMKKNYYGAIYTEQIGKQEFRDKIKEREQRRRYGTSKPKVDNFSKEWIDKFDRT
jgi:hypothetical protein